MQRPKSQWIKHKMISKATLRYIRISPRKVRPVIALIKGKKAEDAISMLHSVKKKASALLIDLINSAVANAERKGVADISTLYVSNLIACGGPQLKRFRAGSMGRASTIRKRTSHITVELDLLTVKGTNVEAENTETANKKIKRIKASENSQQKEAHAVKKSKLKESAKIEHSKKGKE